MLSPCHPPSSSTTQLTAPSRAAVGLQVSTAAATSSLWGMVTDRPAMPRVRAPASAAAACPAGTANPTETQSSPSSAKAALWSRGDSECATGYPITPTTRVAADSPSRPSGSVPMVPVSTAQPNPRWEASASLACWPAKVSENASVPSCWTTTKYSQAPAGGCSAASRASWEGKHVGVGGRPLCR